MKYLKSALRILLGSPFFFVGWYQVAKVGDLLMHAVGPEEQVIDWKRLAAAGAIGLFFGLIGSFALFPVFATGIAKRIISVSAAAYGVVRPGGRRATDPPLVDEPEPAEGA